jgi:hypothetical protein
MNFDSVLFNANTLDVLNFEKQENMFYILEKVKVPILKYCVPAKIFYKIKPQRNNKRIKEILESL